MNRFRPHHRLVAFALLATILHPGRASGQADLDDEELRDRFQYAYDDAKYKEAIAAGRELAKRHPDDAYLAYDLARVYALDEKTISAGTWLKKAAKLGFADIDRASNDPDLVSIRMDPGYIEAIKLIRKNHDEGRTAVHPRVSDSTPLIHVPPGLVETAAAPLVVLLHGWGTTAEDIVAVWKDTADEFGLLLVAPRAIRKAEGTNGYSWDPVEEAEAIVTRAIEHMLGKYRIDKQRIVLSGFSQGGYLAYYVGTRHADTYCGLIPIGGRFDQTIDLASEVAPNRRPKVFIMVGDKDPALAASKRAQAALQAAGYSVKLRIYEGVGHALPDNYREEFRKALQFFWPN